MRMYSGNHIWHFSCDDRSCANIVETEEPKPPWTWGTVGEKHYCHRCHITVMDNMERASQYRQAAKAKLDRLREAAKLSEEW